MYSAEYWIQKLELLKHPEGGYYKETYRSDEFIEKSDLPERFSGDRSVSTAIYFLLTKDDISHLHKLKSDEMWLYHTGGTIELSMFTDNGGYIKKHLGIDPENEECPQILIPKNTVFGAKVIKGDYVLISCTVSPGFDFDDFEFAVKEDLLQNFPDYYELINELSI